MTKKDKAVVWFWLGVLTFVVICLGAAFRSAVVICLGVILGVGWVLLLINVQNSPDDPEEDE